MSKYKYIFTDGLDKMLSSSIYLPNYGGSTAFVYFTDGKLKGYILENEINSLASEGTAFLRSTDNNSWLFKESKRIAAQIENFSGVDSVESFTQMCALLKTAYSLYFYTEEYRTSGLTQTADSALIKQLGEYRLEFIDVCIKATEGVYHRAATLVNKFKLTPKEAQFLTYEEIAKLNTETISLLNLPLRKNAFLLHKLNGSIYTFIGEEATLKYENLISKGDVKRTQSLEGMGASAGIVTGPVFKISLSSADINKEISSMPKGAILVTESTQPSLTLACHKAVAIVTDEGGILSHVAIIARELKIPCVVGTENGTEVLTNGQLVRVDGTTGVVDIVKNR